jgi:regulator of PEP synthase PpsR (kinase-PPPase family)
MKHIYIFSSSAGETGERVIKTTLTQFDDSSTELHRKSHLRTLEEIRKAIEDVEQQPGLLTFSVRRQSDTG